MKNVTVEEAMEIFADYLENANDAEVVQTRKMGLLLISDVSHNQTRRYGLQVEEIIAGDDLASRLLNWEIYDAFVRVKPGDIDPIDRDEETRRRVREIIRPRLQTLPERYAEELDAFFRIP